MEEEFEEGDVEAEVDGVGEREADAFLGIASGLEGPFEGGEVVADEADAVAEPIGDGQGGLILRGDGE